MTLQQTVARLRELADKLPEHVAKLSHAEITDDLMGIAYAIKEDYPSEFDALQNIRYWVASLETREPPAMVIDDEMVKRALAFWDANRLDHKKYDYDGFPWMRDILTAALTKEQK